MLMGCFSQQPVVGDICDAVNAFAMYSKNMRSVGCSTEAPICFLSPVMYVQLDTGLAQSSLKVLT